MTDGQKGQPDHTSVPSRPTNGRCILVSAYPSSITHPDLRSHPPYGTHLQRIQCIKARPRTRPGQALFGRQVQDRFFKRKTDKYDFFKLVCARAGALSREGASDCSQIGTNKGADRRGGEGYLLQGHVLLPVFVSSLDYFHLVRNRRVLLSRLVSTDGYSVSSAPSKQKRWVGHTKRLSD